MLSIRKALEIYEDISKFKGQENIFKELVKTKLEILYQTDFRTRTIFRGIEKYCMI